MENLNGEGRKRAMINMADAYPPGTVEKLVRKFTLDADANTLAIQDTYEFDRTPKTLEEAFITFERATVADDRQSVRIGPKRGGVTLSAVETPGVFRADLLTEESKEGRTGHFITRVAFAPRKLGKQMRLRFHIA